ncbi:hypothetical protein SAY87_006465 [Trapa incisa]|uniref:Uncharacterized protein n=1 Tax=Trapa incisa TaxID=236973 RepID=A0AAN7K2R2_9MYRT|nr:hypothetical protein SAY87_006465 [Trapa incisa]
MSSGVQLAQVKALGVWRSNSGEGLPFGGALLEELVAWSSLLVEPTGELVGAQWSGITARGSYWGVGRDCSGGGSLIENSRLSGSSCTAWSIKLASPSHSSCTSRSIGARLVLTFVCLLGTSDGGEAPSKRRRIGAVVPLAPLPLAISRAREDSFSPSLDSAVQPLLATANANSQTSRQFWKIGDDNGVSVYSDRALTSGMLRFTLSLPKYPD